MLEGLDKVNAVNYQVIRLWISEGVGVYFLANDTTLQYSVNGQPALKYPQTIFTYIIQRTRRSHMLTGNMGIPYY